MNEEHVITRWIALRNSHDGPNRLDMSSLGLNETECLLRAREADGLAPNWAILNPVISVKEYHMTIIPNQPLVDLVIRDQKERVNALVKAYNPVNDWYLRRDTIN